MTCPKDIHAASTLRRSPLALSDTVCPTVLHLRLTNHCRIAAAWSICRGDQSQPTDWAGDEKQDTAEWSYRSFAVFKFKNDSSIVAVIGKDKPVLLSIICYRTTINLPTNENIYCVLTLCHMLSTKPTSDPHYGCWHGAERLRGMLGLHSGSAEQGGHWASQLQFRALHIHIALYAWALTTSWNISDLESHSWPHQLYRDSGH